MRCPECGNETRVGETRDIAGNNRRRRVCPNCGHRFTTIETIVQSNQKYNDVVLIILPRPKARELREALALLDRGLAGELSQHPRSEGAEGEGESAKRAEGDPLAVLPPPGLEDS